ncbi:MAG: hypothetical protein ACI9HY_000004 [Planctomycetaceae bacterium]|jgi:hypothetical protein
MTVGTGRIFTSIGKQHICGEKQKPVIEILGSVRSQNGAKRLLENQGRVSLSKKDNLSIPWIFIQLALPKVNVPKPQ